MHEPMSRRERHEQTHERILALAMETVVAQGFHALSMNKLAAQVGFTPGALYRYFEGKDSIVSALVVSVVDEVGARLMAAMAGLEPIEALRAAAAVWFDYAREAPHRFGLVSAMLGAPQIVIADDRRAREAIARTLVALAPVGGALAEAARRGLIAEGDAQTRTLLFFCGLQGVLGLRKQAERAPDELDLAGLYEAMLDNLLRGFGLRQAAARRPGGRR